MVRTFSFDDFLKFGLENCGEQRVNGIPWSFKLGDLPVTHETDDLYLISLKDGETIQFPRYAVMNIDFNNSPKNITIFYFNSIKIYYL